MPVELRGLRVFIATPGGLNPERQRFREILLRFNEDDAHERGVAFIPVGWELSLAGLGRPQEIINDDVRRSDYLVLVLWDRWGTPPSKGGPYTSGTEEEYNVARECILDETYPMRDIVVLFKGVDPQRLSDPGEQLQKVLSFKQLLEQEKSLLFSTFDSIDEFDRHLQRHLLRWMRDEDEGKTVPSVPPPPPSPPRGEADDIAVEDQADLLAEAERLADEGKLTQAESLFARAVVARVDLQAITKYTRFLRRTGRLDQAVATSERLLELSRQLGDRHAEIEALSNRAIIRRKQGEFRPAIDDLTQAVEVAQSLGSDGLADLAFLYDNLGLTLRKEGDFAAAVRMHESALATRKDLDDPRGLANGYNHLGALLRQQGQVARAEEMHQEAIRLFADLGYQRGEAQARANLGEDFQAQGKLTEATAEYEHSLALNEALNSPEGIGMNLWQLGRVALERDDVDAAREYAYRGMGADDKSGRPEGVGGALQLLGEVEMTGGDVELAERALRAALHIYDDSGQRLGIAWTASDLARAQLALGKRSEAKTTFEIAVSAAAGLDHVQLQGALDRTRRAISEADEAATGGAERLRLVEPDDAGDRGDT
jgi:tetratricopeptide (TPR) repeat protein